jgi:hypothetical protein
MPSNARGQSAVRVMLDPGQVAGLDSEEGRSLSLTCGEDAATRPGFHNPPLCQLGPGGRAPPRRDAQGRGAGGVSETRQLRQFWWRLLSGADDPAIAAHHGRIIKRTGDGSIIQFWVSSQAGFPIGSIQKSQLGPTV